MTFHWGDEIVPSLCSNEEFHHTSAQCIFERPSPRSPGDTAVPLLHMVTIFKCPSKQRCRDRYSKWVCNSTVQLTECSGVLLKLFLYSTPIVKICYLTSYTHFATYCAKKTRQTELLKWNIVPKQILSKWMFPHYNRS